MIPFFRKLRQRLLAENRFGRYLMYAIGEILLVVIGILIALQVNNWNEARKEHRQVLGLLGNLQDELRQDSLHFRNVHTAETTLFLPSARVLFDVHRGALEPEPGDTLIARAFRFASFTPYVKYSDHAYRRLMASDLLDPLAGSDSLKMKLLEYYGQIDFLNRYSEQTTGLIDDMTRDLAPFYSIIPEDGFSGREISGFAGAGEGHFDTRYDLEGFRNHTALNPKLFDMIDIHLDRLGGLEIIQQLNAELLELLKRYK